MLQRKRLRFVRFFARTDDPRSMPRHLNWKMSCLTSCVLAACSLFPFPAFGESHETTAVEYLRPKQLAHLTNRNIAESSGLACSRRADGIFWTHNDSGDIPRVYAFDADGSDRGTFVLTGAQARDWEDMASFVLNDRPCLLVADIGDNTSTESIYTLYVIEEPELADGAPPQDVEVPILQTVFFRYADGSHDGESIAFDSREKSVFLATKDMRKGCGVYAVPWPKRSNTKDKPIVARRVATTQFPMATAMDMSPDGCRAVIATYGLAFEFVRLTSQSWSQALAQSGRPVILPFRRQGESICYGADGKTLYLTSEKLPTPFFELPTK